MAFIDDWGGTSSADKKQLQETCQRAGCNHVRYLHGSTRTVRGAWKWIEYEAGKCVRCKCEAFQPEGAITKDEIIDTVELLAGEIHLNDYEAWQVCNQVITRWVGGLATIDVPCGLKPEHAGAHEAKD